MAHSPHRQHKGCQLCKPHKSRRNGRAVREPWPVLRKTGKRRRLRRRDIGDAADELGGRAQLQGAPSQHGLMSPQPSQRS